MNKVSNNLIIELHVPDFEQARIFYSIFGFNELLHKPVSTSELGYLILKRHDSIGETHLNFYGDNKKISEQSYFKKFPNDTLRGYGTEITIPVTDVEEFWNSVKDKVIEDQIAQSLTLKRWGKKDFRIVDPFGFYIRFTELVDWGQ